MSIAERTLTAVFKKSGVKKAHAHRYRHTLTRLLAEGATFELVAGYLRKHGEASAPVTFPVTPQSHEKLEAVN